MTLDPREYKAPNLFPEFGKQGDYIAQKDYLRQRMEEMAEEQTLCLTHIMNQPRPIPDLCGEIILGIQKDITNDEHVGFIRDDMPNSDALERYVIPIEALPKATVDEYDYYSEKHVKVPWTVRCKLPARGQRRWRTDANGHRMAWIEYEEVHYDSGERFSREPIARAWRILKQTGALCRRAKGRSQQVAFWRCRELFPGEKPSKQHTPTPPKKRVGRPKKDAKAAEEISQE